MTLSGGGSDVPGARVPGPGAAGPVCVGRDAEVGLLAGLARRVAAGRGGVVWVEGEPGIGKTTLLDLVAAECARLAVRTLRGGAEELERRLPFAAVSAVLGVRRAGAAGDPALARLGALLWGEQALGSSVSAAGYELAVVEAVLELVDRWCAAGPVALVLDDVQWADAASAVVLHKLGRAVEAERLPVLMVLAARPVPRGEAVARLVHSLVAHGARSLAVAPLRASAVAELVEQLLGVSAGPRLVGLVAGAGGNPMYVAELVAALSREGLVQVAGGVAEVVANVPGPAALPGSGWVPRSLVDALQRRLSFLPPKVRDTLEMAAVLGASVDVTELSAVLGMSLAGVSEVVAEAMAAGLLAEAGGLLAFRHDLIRQVLAANRPASVRTALRLRAGQVLAAAGAPVERVAEHLVAGATLERTTVEWLVRSADTLTVRVPELAVRLLRQASASTQAISTQAISTQDPASRVAQDPAAEGDLAGVLRFHLIRALLWAGELVEAEHAAMGVLAAGPAPAREGALRWLLAQARYRQGRLGDTVAAVADALASPRLTPAEVGRFHGLAASSLHFLGRFAEAEAAAGKAVAAGEGTGDTVASVYGYTMLATRHYARGELTHSLHLAGRAVALLKSGTQSDEEVAPHVISASCLLGLDRLAEADEVVTRSLRHDERVGGVYLVLSYAVRARVRFLDGRWDDALAEVQAGLGVPDPHHFGVALPPLAALVAVHRGTHTPGPTEAVGPERGMTHSLATWAAALAEEARGNPRQALDLLHPTWEKPPVWGHQRATYDLCPDLARIACTVGDAGRVRELAATTADLAAREPSPSMTGTALLCQGLAEGEVRLLEDAVRCFREAGRPLYEGYGHEEAAVLLARHGNTAEARRALDDALALYAGLDAAWDASRAQARLRRLGVRRGRRAALRRRPAHGWEALTETEHKVAALVAEGLSNPDIATKMCLSRRTVQSHVSSILAKLGLASRVEVAVNAQRREPS